jgi:hypothetical protein
MLSPGEIALVLQEQIEQLFRRARLGQRRAIELQSLGAGNRVFETKAEKPREREAIPSSSRGFHSAGSKRKKRCPTPNSRRSKP